MLPDEGNFCDDDQQLLLGLRYISGLCLDDKFFRGLELILEAFEHGNKKALETLEKLSDGGMPVIARKVGEIYYYGEGKIQPDAEEARRWFHKARAQGDAEASFMLATIASDEGDYGTMMEYFIEAAERGQPDAAEHIAQVRTDYYAEHGLTDNEDSQAQFDQFMQSIIMDCYNGKVNLRQDVTA